MATDNKKTLNALVFEIVTRRLKLTRCEAAIFYKLLGFLIRNDKAFPYSTSALAKNTFYSKRSVVYALSELERKRIIVRKGLGYNRRFTKGSILDKSLSIAQNSIKKDLYKSLTTAQPLRRPTQKLRTIKHEELKDIDNRKHWCPKYHQYVKSMENDKKLGIISTATSILNYDQWLFNMGPD